MEPLKKIAQLCRQHYEKLILIAALLLLAAAVVYLYQASQEEERLIQEKPRELQRKAAKPVPPVNLAPFEAALKEATNRPTLNFSGKHNLFNPVKWQQARPGSPIVKVETGKEVGVESVQIVRITPLYLSIAFDRVATSGTAPDITVAGYQTVVTNEIATIPRMRRLPQFIPPNTTNSQVFVLTEVKGPPEAPTEFIATLRDFNNEKISFGPGKPYTRIVGYEAELKYPVLGRTYPRLRKESAVDIDGEPYKIVDIAPTRVVLSDDSNGKRYAIEQVAAP
jgi:hypothetical protein